MALEHLEGVAGRSARTPQADTLLTPCSYIRRQCSEAGMTRLLQKSNIELRKGDLVR
jgi:hypothetical protein